MIGIIGTTSIEVRKDQGSKIITITQRGASKSNVIPSVVVVCEDAIAAKVLDLVNAETKGSYRVVTAGAWGNMATLLYGMYFYRRHLQETGDTRFLEVLCVTDGDITPDWFQKVIKETHRGTHAPDHIKETLSLIEQSLISFKLSDHPEKTKGIPEYNHKKWLDEISEEHVNKYFETRLAELNSFLERSKRDQEGGIGIEIWHIKKEISETLRIIEVSQKMKFKAVDDLVDYHAYYKRISAVLKRGDTLMHYHQHDIVYSVLSIIRKFNPVRWHAYITPVKEAMEEASFNQTEVFRKDRFNNTEIL
ncbi:hypothetical protein ACJ8PD_02985 [Serratia sp. CY70267]|uniref:Uncharacterized protein n=1 Tax=Rahnella bonaserana TaxID=2816248 RepID=A0ABS6LUN1_9GAMM|nr:MULTISPECIES: hypothetical protein [Enterobacterales]MBU9855810.1 hypothetical protein [Rahnella bonaserana]MCJ6764941.1 hypothetical protein [Klebsiella variicola]